MESDKSEVYRTLKARPNAKSLIKPGELVDLVEVTPLTLADRRIYNQLLENAHFEGATVSTIDGLRADFEDGWGLVRASNTTPVLVLRFEADSDEALARIMGDFRRVMLQVNMHLSLPF